MTFDVDERTSRTYRAKLTDAAGSPVALAALVALTLSLYVTDDFPTSAADATFVNGREGQNVLNDQGVTYDEQTGELVWEITPADTAVQDATLAYETHRALFRWRHDDGFGVERDGYHVVDLRVRNLKLVS